MKNLKFLTIGVFLLSGLWTIAQTPIHDYELNNSYSDVYGGNPMVPSGGTLTPTSYDFDFGQGPNVSGVIDAYTYSIELRYAPYSIDRNWQKILDFKNRSSDNGLYILYSTLILVSEDETGFVFTGDVSSVLFDAGTPAIIVITRDDANNEVRGYVNGVQQWVFTDDNADATFTGPGNIIQILIDDFVTNGDEHSAGILDYFKIYNVVLTPEQVACKFNGYGMNNSIDTDCDGVSNDCDVCPGGDDSGPCDAATLPPLSTLPSFWLCSNNNNSEKIKVCHDGTTLCVSENAAATHLAHGDFLGPCVSCPQNFTAPIGNSNHDMEGEILAFPNPTNSTIKLKLPRFQSEEAVLSIISVTGQELLSQKVIRDQQVELDFSSQTSGIYLIEVKSADGHYQKKIVKCE